MDGAVCSLDSFLNGEDGGEPERPETIVMHLNILHPPESPRHCFRKCGTIAVPADLAFAGEAWSSLHDALPLANQGYDHQPRSISASGDPAHIVMPRVHRVAALLDRWWLGIHHGAIDADHLDYYLDEFTFRFNRRRSQARGLLFFRLLQQAVQHEPVPYPRRRPETFHTAIATAFFLPTSTTSRLPRVTPM